MEIFFLAMLLGINVGMIARSKGYGFFPWWLYGSLLFIIAIVHVLLIKPNAGHLERQAISAGGKKCPMCAEIVKADAKICRFCGFTDDEQLLQERAAN
jgi:Uncharacterised protein family UPF0547